MTATSVTTDGAPTGGEPAQLPRRRVNRFGARLLLAQAAVVIAMALTTGLVSTLVGPSIFHDHLRQAGVGHTAAETRHVEEAFWSAQLISLGLSLLVAVAAAFAVSAYFSRRVQRSVGAVTATTAQIGAGRYTARVADPGLGAEFATLSATINALAERLHATESTRRRMLSDLAHEMRTPLATIDAHVEAVEDGVRELDASTLRIISSSTGRLRRLAEDIGAVSRAEEGNLPIDLAAADARDLAQAAVVAGSDRYLAKGVALRIDVPADPVPVRADRDRLGQVLGNLLDNALRHTAAGGSVSVTCRRQDGQVTIAVNDTGDGIDAEHIGHVFDRFYRVDTARDREHGGSGIGLAIAKALVEAHGGFLTATSPGLGRGATFTVHLPAAS